MLCVYTYRLAANTREDLRESLPQILAAASLMSSNPNSMQHTAAASALLRHCILFEESLTLETVKEVLLCLEKEEEGEGGVNLLQEVEAVKEWMTKDFSDAVEVLGKGCSNPGSFQGALLAMLTSSSYPDVVRKIIRSGGCNCSKNNFAGACFGALYGLGGEKGIPTEWIEKTEGIEEIMTLALERVACEETAGHHEGDSSEL